MTILTLSDISQLYQQRSYQFNTSSNSTSSLQQSFHLLVKQKQLGLPIEPLLEEYQLLANWLEQLEQFIPGL